MKIHNIIVLALLSLSISGCGGSASESGANASQEPEEVVETVTRIEPDIVQPIEVGPTPSRIEPIPEIDPPSPLPPRKDFSEL